MIQHGPLSDYPIPRITVNIVQIDNLIKINTLSSLLSQLDLHTLCLVPGGTMNDMLRDTPLQNKASEIIIVCIYLNIYFHPMIIT